MSTVPTIVVHSGRFHCDEVIGCMVLKALHPEYQIVRSRDPEVIKRGTFVLDVGGVWDPAAGRFDHHQSDFNLRRSFIDGDGNEIFGCGYATSGLVWREYGVKFVAQIALDLNLKVSDAICERVANEIDGSFIRYIDMVDTGEERVAPGYSGLSNLISALNQSWVESSIHDPVKRANSQHKRFELAVEMTYNFLQGIVCNRLSSILAHWRFTSSPTLDNGKILLVDQPGVNWTTTVAKEMPKVCFVIYPDSDSQQFHLRTVQMGTFGLNTSRVNIPDQWAGLTGKDLVKASGIAEASFCHKGLFIAGALNKEGAIAMARKCISLHKANT